MVWRTFVDPVHRVSGDSQHTLGHYPAAPDTSVRHRSRTAEEPDHQQERSRSEAIEGDHRMDN